MKTFLILILCLPFSIAKADWISQPPKCSNNVTQEEVLTVSYSDFVKVGIASDGSVAGVVNFDSPGEKYYMGDMRISNVTVTAAIGSCDAKELYDGFAELKEIDHPDAYCSQGACSHIKQAKNNSYTLHCRELTLVTHKEQPSYYTCVVYEVKDYEIKEFGYKVKKKYNDRIKDLNKFNIVLSSFGIKRQSVARRTNF